MFRFAVAVVAISLVCWEASAFNVPGPDGRFPVGPGSEFPIDSIITCDVPASAQVFRASNGRLQTIPEEPPLIGLIPVPGSEVYLPEPSRFAFPPVDPLPISTIMVLINAIGSELNFGFQDIRFRPFGPNDTAQLICNISDPALPPNVTDLEDPTPSAIYNELIDTTEANNVSTAELELLDDFPVVLTNNLNLLNCDKALRAIWTALPITFFPRYYVGQSCNQRNCAYPAEGEQLCRPDLNPDTQFLLTVFRWDCCWSVVGRTNLYVCGWRRVHIPVVCDCDCVCE